MRWWSCVNEGKPVDLVTLQNRLKEKDVPPDISSMEFVRELIDGSSDLGKCQILCEYRAAKKRFCARLIKVNRGDGKYLLCWRKRALEDDSGKN